MPGLILGCEAIPAVHRGLAAQTVTDDLMNGLLLLPAAQQHGGGPLAAHHVAEGPNADPRCHRLVRPASPSGKPRAGSVLLLISDPTGRSSVERDRLS